MLFCPVIEGCSPLLLRGRVVLNEKDILIEELFEIVAHQLVAVVS